MRSSGATFRRLLARRSGNDFQTGGFVVLFLERVVRRRSDFRVSRVWNRGRRGEV